MVSLLDDADKFKYLGSMFVANSQGFEEIRSRILSPAILSFLAYESQGLPGSNALDFALQLLDVACTSSRRKDVGDLCQ